MSFAGDFIKKTVVKALDLFSGNFDSLQLKQCLHSPDPSIVIAAIKHILANMTIAKDMSAHFTDVAKLVSSPNFEIKRLVYLYLMHNAKSQPEKVVLYAGTFVRDTLHESPLIRGIALRTMSSLQVPAMVDFAHGVVLRCLDDKDPYVKRNATVAVLKIHRVSPTIIVSEPAIMRKLIELLSDPVATVVASAACALVELLQSQLQQVQQQQQQHQSGSAREAGEGKAAASASAAGSNTILNTLTSHTDTLLAALQEATEWSQVYLLNALTWIFKPPKTQADQLARPPPKTPAEAETVITRVSHLLQSSNPAVVIGAARLLVNLLLTFSPVIPGIKSPLTTVQQAQFERTIGQKVAGPLVSMLSGLRFEIRYVALRSIKALLHRFKDAFVPFITQFFVKFDDPIFIKLEKIDVMLAIATRANAELVLSEFAEYSLEVDPEVVRRAVRSIGILAVRVSSVTPQCVERLVILIESKVNFVVQEAAVVVQQVLRQHPTSYEGVIAKLTGALKVLDEPESKAAVVWVIGEYGGRRIANAAQILTVFLENFADETPLVQRAILTAAMKVYLTEPTGGEEKQKLLEQVFGLCTSSPVPDLRDRAFFYWRLLRADPTAAQRVVCGKREQIVDSGFLIQDRLLLSNVLSDLGNLTSVCMKSPGELFGDGQGTKVHYDDADKNAGVHANSGDAESGIHSSDYKSGSKQHQHLHQQHASHADAANSLEGSTSGVHLGSSAGAGDVDLEREIGQASRGGAAASSSVISATLKQVLSPEQNKGLSVSAAWIAGSSSIASPSLKLRFSLSDAFNSVLKSLKVDLLQINGNALGIGLAKDFAPFELSSSSGTATSSATSGQYDVVLPTNANNARKATLDIQVAVRTDALGVIFFRAPDVPLELALSPALPPGYDASAYAQDFSQLTVAWALPSTQQGSRRATGDRAVSQHALQIHRLHLIHRNDQPPLVGLHVFASTANGTKLFSEITLENGAIVLLNVKCSDDNVTLAEPFASYILRTIAI